MYSCDCALHWIPLSKDFSTASTDRNTEVISPIYEQTERPPRSQRNLTTLSSDALP
eukprot:m.936508 g.936508  ORF g.936508 m.936508 type:complete len:56 (-) comp23809_c1_seq20:1765-1932(-)